MRNIYEENYLWYKYYIFVFTENYDVLDSIKQSLAANVPNIILNRYYVSQLHRKPVLLGNPSKGKIIICFFILIL